MFLLKKKVYIGKRVLQSEHSVIFIIHVTCYKYFPFAYIIFPVILCGCETWSLKLREERNLRVFENKVLRRIFGPRRDEVTE